MIKYNNTNNASTTLTAGISASSTTLIVENGDILPTAPFLLTLEHFDNEKVTVREIVKCIAKAGNILTIQRGAGTCVQDDSASTKEQGNSAHSFSVGDCASIYWTSEQVQDIQNEIEKKLNIDDFQAGTYVYGATSTGTDAYSITIPGTLTSYAVGQVFRFMADVDNEGNATLNINGLGAVEIRKNHDKILDNGDIEAGQIVEVAYDGTYFQMDSQVATVVDLGNINRLNEKLIVGETYTLSDECFLQKTPEYNNCNYDNGIGNGTGSTEVHIQRISNGVSFNIVKIKVKKVGSPTTNLKMEIREGVLVTSDNSSYWYGDETKILATSSKTYSNFTTDYQEISFSFNEDVQIENGKLIDVVLYQEVGGEAHVDGTNYYMIASDQTQWSECFTLLNFDGTNYTRNTYCLGGYCVSDGFVDAVASKMKQHKESQYNVWSYTAPGTSTVQSTDAPMTIGRYGRFWFATGNHNTATVHIDNEKVYEGDLSNFSYVIHADKTSYNFKVTYGEYRVKWVLYRKDYIPGSDGNHKIKPNAVYEIGTAGTFTSFGRLPNGDWRTGE